MIAIAGEKIRMLNQNESSYKKFIKFSGVCTVKGNIKSRIIFSGDPKQLDAVTKSTNAKVLHFNTSLMERLSKLPASHMSNGNECVMMQLTNNYRSHEDILHVPNLLFYDGKLKAKAPTGMFETLF